MNKFQQHNAYAFIFIGIFACTAAIQAVTPTKPPRKWYTPKYFTFSSTHIAKSGQKAQEKVQKLLVSPKKRTKADNTFYVTPSKHDGIDRYVAAMHATEQMQKSTGQ